ncbi:PREDICTED: X-ray repair cross-complementing protein 6-like [Polistes canadensis]|uniref:X-ray repair cross-complementing protein 6-like n=1 Tax=Polistes canadensis TaxID=91411 RepID=UPI000719010A|nr:PREDICTED: X-ray repair cross-complementing protein 6-like [Polistes canadensis]
MTSENAEELDSENDSEETDNIDELYGVRDCTIFLIDTSPEMFNTNEEGIPYFVSCIEDYIYILKQKLVWNRKDWMGLVLFGTEQWDMNPEIRNILTLQKLSVIDINKLKEAEKIRDSKWKDYESMSSSTSYPLQDVLWHAALNFSSVNITMSARRVILYTCHDVPPLTNEDEKHNIRAKVATYSDLDILLYVVAQGKQWDVELFYKDLEMLSRNISKEDYQRTSYKDLLQQVKRPSRHMAKLPWRLGKNVVINVDISNLCVASQNIKSIVMSSETNTPLVPNTYLRKKEDSDVQKNEEDEDKIIMPLLQADVRKMKKLGGRELYFTLDEVKSFENIYKMGIDLLGVEPLFCDPMYHIHAPYFISCNKNCSEGEKLLFAALLNKCDQRKLKITCRVTMRENSGSYLYYMIPMPNEGGFYLYKMPYNEEVNDFTEEMYTYAYDDKDKKVPINHEAVELFEKIIKKSTQIYDPEKYPNPALQVKLQSIETLALDLDVRDPPEDLTLPAEDLLQERIGDLTKQINELFIKEEEEYEPPKKKRRNPKNSTNISFLNIQDEDVLELINNNELDRCNVSDLRKLLSHAKLSTTGRKSELIERLTSHYT